jgi:hypothetical protein
VVTIAGTNYYLGPFGSSESREKYARLIAEWEASGRKQPPQSASDISESIRVKDLIRQYYRLTQIEYVDENGEPTTEVTSIRIALRRLRKLFGNVAVAGFGPKILKLVQSSLTAEGLSRKYINDSINRIRRMFRWGASEELLSPTVLLALQTVPGLTKRRGKRNASSRWRTQSYSGRSNACHRLLPTWCVFNALPAPGQRKSAPFSPG